MAIGIVSDNEFSLELERIGNRTVPSLESVQESVQEIVIENLPSKGRSDGDMNVPDSLRKIIGETAVIEGRSEALSLAKEFGVSSSSVSAYAKGSTSTKSYDSPSASLISHINKSRVRAITKASKVMNLALGTITQEKLDYADPKDLSSIAKDMSAIIKNLEPSDVVTESDNRPQFVIFAPQFRKEESFEVITVSE